MKGCWRRRWEMDKNMKSNEIWMRDGKIRVQERKKEERRWVGEQQEWGGEEKILPRRNKKESKEMGDVTGQGKRRKVGNKNYSLLRCLSSHTKHTMRQEIFHPHNSKPWIYRVENMSIKTFWHIVCFNMYSCYTASKQCRECLRLRCKLKKRIEYEWRGNRSTY